MGAANVAHRLPHKQPRSSGLVLGGVLGCMRSLDTHESTHRLTMVRTLDSIAQVAWDGANLTAIGCK